MKKSMFCLLVLVLFACEEKAPYSVSITNNSSTKSVSYIYNDISDTLAVSETKQYEVKAYTQAPKNITDQNGIASITTKQNGMTGNYTFIDAPSFNLSVINRLPIDITIKADNYIDNNGSMELTITSGEEITDTGAIIYTKSPIFTSNTTDYPISFEYTIDKDNMNVIIR